MNSFTHVYSNHWKLHHLNVVRSCVYLYTRPCFVFLDTLSVGSPSISSMNNSSIFHDQSRPTSHEPQSDIYRMASINNNKQEPLRSLETPTYDVQLPGLPKAPSRQQQSPEFQQVVNQMAERIHGIPMGQPIQTSMAVPGVMLQSPTQASAPSRSHLVSDLWFKQAQPQLHTPPIDHMHHHRQRNTFAGNLPIQQPFNSLTITPEGQLQTNLVKTAPNVPSHAFIAQNFSPQPSSFGVIGQNIRPPPPVGMHAIPVNSVLQTSYGTPTIPLPQRQWAAPPPGIPGPMGEGRRVCIHLMSTVLLQREKF